MKNLPYDFISAHFAVTPCQRIQTIHMPGRKGKRRAARSGTSQSQRAKKKKQKPLSKSEKRRAERYARRRRRDKVKERESTRPSTNSSPNLVSNSEIVMEMETQQQQGKLRIRHLLSPSFRQETYQSLNQL